MKIFTLAYLYTLSLPRLRILLRTCPPFELSSRFSKLLPSSVELTLALPSLFVPSQCPTPKFSDDTS
ncbi:hypothetical protein BDY24DRAFT_390917 [Mrakia frigida]|uniref:uncharacterized protein n=1 Tax=Mrakia frigida TaxID=29902 RepID=UPI003FCC0E43